MRPLDRLHVEVAVALVFEDRRIATVREGTRVTVAHARQVVLVPAKRLGHSLRLKRTVTVVYHSPHHIILKHYI